MSTTAITRIDNWNHRHGRDREIEVHWEPGKIELVLPLGDSMATLTKWEANAISMDLHRAVQAQP